MKEAQVIEKLITKDEEAFRWLVNGQQERIFKVCLGFMHNKEEAEDITQEVFIEVMTAIHSFKGQSTLSTWLYRVAVNKCLNRLQRIKTRQFFMSLQKAVGWTKESTSHPGNQLEQKEKAAMLFKAIAQLPNNQRIAYTLAKYDDLSYKEIAEIMNLSISSVESLLFRAKANLQKKLIRYVKGEL